MAAVESVGVIGLGNMGSGMAASLARGGFRVVGFDTDPAKAVPGVTAAGSLAELAAGSDAVLTMLPDSPQVEAALLGPDGVSAHARPGTLVIDSSTVAAATTEKLDRSLTEAGLAFIDAPVGRAPANAADGTLMFMVGAHDADLARAMPLLEAMGTDINHCGAPGRGIAMKLVLNTLSLSTCQLSAEVVALGEKMGLEIDTMLPVLTGGLGRNGYLATYWPTKVLAGDTEPGFAIKLAAKDLGLAMDMAAEAGAALPTARAAAEAVQRANEKFGDLDVSGLLTVAERGNEE